MYILLINETHFTNKSYFRIPSNGTHAGTAIIIKNSNSDVELDKFLTSYLQATVIKVNLLPYKLTVAADCGPRRHNINIK